MEDETPENGTMVGAYCPGCRTQTELVVVGRHYECACGQVLGRAYVYSKAHQAMIREIDADAARAEEAAQAAEAARKKEGSLAPLAVAQAATVAG